GAVGDDQLAGAGFDQASGRELSHFSGADQQYGLVRKLAENLSSQLNCNGADRYRILGDCGFSSYSFGDGQRSMHQLAKYASDGPSINSVLVCFFNLTEDLRFPNHH